MQRYDQSDFVEAASGFLDPGAAEPLYRQVRRYVESAVATGTLRPGRPLPSSRYLAQALGVSRNTVNLAYQELVAAAVLESRPRSGLYLAPRVAEHTHRHDPAAGPVPTRATVDWARWLRQPAADDGLPSPDRPDWRDYRYPFLPGQPEPGQFPARAWLRALNDALSGPHLPPSIQDSGDGDDPLLVEVLCRDILPARGVRATPERVVVTNGAQQALALVADVLVGPGTQVALEDPGYVDAARIFAHRGARLHPLPVDGQGAVVNRLRPSGGPCVVYLTPSHHHPTNVTLSRERRESLLRLAEQHRMLVIEDDYDSEVRYRGRPTPSLTSMDTGGRVVYVGTFSKFVAPGLRMGFVVGDPELVAAVRARRRLTTKHPAGHLQRALALFIDSGEYHRALRRHRNHLRQKWELTTRLLPDALGFDLGDPPAGGLGVWAVGPPGFDAVRVAALARRRGVLVDPGADFHLFRPRPTNALRVGFSAIPRASIADGLVELGQAVREARTAGA